ncbi:MAG: hypothetical protein IPN76_18650 [Saprospiraceae bacterium]|nr:hypothetical protein [Saprospiraceae bacterium]
MDQKVSRSFLNYLHKIGDCLYYEKVDLLKNIIILENQWATKAIYQVIEDTEIKNRNGYFKTEDLWRIWWSKKNDRILGQNEGKHIRYLNELKQLMEYYKLCYPIHIGSLEFIVPMLLPSEIGRELPIMNHEDEVIFVYKFEYLPSALFYQFITECNELIDGDEDFKYVSSNEVGLRYGNASALASKVTIGGNEGFLFQIDGNNVNDFIWLSSQIEKRLDNLKKGLPELGRKKSFPCKCNFCRTQAITERSFFDEEDIEIYKENGKKDIYCHKSRKFIELEKLTKDINGETEDLTNLQIPKAIILSDDSDKNFLEKFKTHMALLVREELIELWDEASCILAGDLKDEKFKAALDSADIIFILASSALLANHDIDKELADKFERVEKEVVVIVPIIVSSCLWKATKIQSIRVLPMDETPIDKSSNQNESWHEISRQIRPQAERIKTKVNARRR